MTVEYISKDAEGSRFLNTLRTNSRLEPAHLEIYTKLGLSGRPLNRRLLKRKIGSDNKNNQAVFQESYFQDQKTQKIHFSVVFAQAVDDDLMLGSKVHSLHSDAVG